MPDNGQTAVTIAMILVVTGVVWTLYSLAERIF